MTVAEWMMRVSQGTFNRMRSSQASHARDAKPSGALDDLRGRKYCLVVTYRKNGESVPTPVWFGLGDDTVYFRSLANNGKTKRIRHTPEVRIAPCTSRGRPLGSPFVGNARILTPAEEPEAERCITENFGFGRRLYNRLVAHRVEGVYIAVTPDTPTTGDAGQPSLQRNR
jgi:PPOX class probable F420-dependent enzyme